MYKGRWNIRLHEPPLTGCTQRPSPSSKCIAWNMTSLSWTRYQCHSSACTSKCIEKLASGLQPSTSRHICSLYRSLVMFLPLVLNLLTHGPFKQQQTHWFLQAYFTKITIIASYIKTQLFSITPNSDLQRNNISVWINVVHHGMFSMEANCLIRYFPLVYTRGVLECNFIVGILQLGSIKYHVR